MPLQLIVRAAIVLACAAGIVVAVISYQSQRSFDRGYERAVQGRLDERTAELLEDARPLNPEPRIDQGLALVELEQGGEPAARMRRAIEDEPENAGLLSTYVFVLTRLGREEEAEVAYRRLSELDPQRFPPR